VIEIDDEPGIHDKIDWREALGVKDVKETKDGKADNSKYSN
jgi:hypothetical protein